VNGGGTGMEKAGGGVKPEDGAEAGNPPLRLATDVSGVIVWGAVRSSITMRKSTLTIRSFHRWRGEWDGDRPPLHHGFQLFSRSHVM